MADALIITQREWWFISVSTHLDGKTREGTGDPTTPQDNGVDVKRFVGVKSFHKK